LGVETIGGSGVAGRRERERQWVSIVVGRSHGAFVIPRKILQFCVILWMERLIVCH